MSLFLSRILVCYIHDICISLHSPYPIHYNILFIPRLAPQQDLWGPKPNVLALLSLSLLKILVLRHILMYCTFQKFLSRKHYLMHRHSIQITIVHVVLFKPQPTTFHMSNTSNYVHCECELRHPSYTHE